MPIASETDFIAEILTKLKRGDCWCERGIGNPMFKDHSEGCRMAQFWMDGYLLRCKPSGFLAKGEIRGKVEFKPGKWKKLSTPA